MSRYKPPSPDQIISGLQSLCECDGRGCWVCMGVDLLQQFTALTEERDLQRQALVNLRRRVDEAETKIANVFLPEIARLQSDIQLMAAPHESVGHIIMEYRRERDEALAEIARLTQQLEAAADLGLRQTKDAIAAIAHAQKANYERDEAHAEIARLTEALALWRRYGMFMHDTGCAILRSQACDCGHEARLAAALKEDA